MFMSDKMFNTLRWIAQLLLPGLATLYSAVGALWGLPYVLEIVGTISAVNVFLGGLLGLSRSAYNALEAVTDGTVVIDTRNPDKDVWSLVLNTPLSEIEGKDSVTLTVAPKRAIEQ